VLSFHLTRSDATFLPVMTLNALRPVCKNAGERLRSGLRAGTCAAPGRSSWDWTPGVSCGSNGSISGICRQAVPRRRGAAHAGDALTQRFSSSAARSTTCASSAPGRCSISARHPMWSKYGSIGSSTRRTASLLNTRMKPFDDVRVEAGVAAAVNRPHFQQYFEGLSKATGHLIPPGCRVRSTYEGRGSISPRARVDGGGGVSLRPEDGLGGYPETIQYLRGRAKGPFVCSVLQYDLAQIGLKVELKTRQQQRLSHARGRPNTVGLGSPGGIWTLPIRATSSTRS